MTDILLIDQDCLFQRAFTKMVGSDDSCRLVGIADNGPDAMAMISSRRPQMIFCDIMLGLENGLSLCERIKKKFPETALYILSNYCNIGLLQDAMKVGVREYLFKPLSRSKFFGLVKETSSRNVVAASSPYIDRLYDSIEERDYKKSYDIVGEISTWLYDECSKKEREEHLLALQSGLINLIPGLDQVQRDYFLSKFEITPRIVSKKFLCYSCLVEIITEVYSRICTMRYTHMSKVFRFIEKNLHNEISLADLSAQAGISSGYLSRIFRKYYKISVVDYIHLRKILKAKNYMVMSEMNISDISFLMGYSEAGYFCKIFKKYEGKTPSAYHRELKDKPKAS